MITKEKYLERSDKIAEIEDPDEQAKKAEEFYQELALGMTVTIIAHDWKDYTDHMREVCKKVKELDTTNMATNMHHFPSYHDYPHGSLDTIVTVVSKEDITEEEAEMLVDLVVNLGAEGT